MTCQASTSGSSSLAAENICQVSNSIKDGMDEYESNISTKIFTEEQQILLLTEINERSKCKTCATDYVKRLAYEVAYEIKEPYPKSWDKNQKIKSVWLRKFENKHKDKIPKFQCDYKKILSHNQTTTSKEVFQTILPIADEQLLLTQRQGIETRHDRYKNPLTTEDINLSYKVKSKWQKKFKGSHKDEISKLSHDCKKKLSQNQASTSKTEEQFQTILHTDDEQSLLIQSQETETRHNKCLRPLITEELNLSHEVKKCYPESSNSNEQAERELFNFEERHKDKILKFPHDCKIESSHSQTSTSRGQKFHFRFQSILTTDDEQLLLTKLQEVKTRYGCKCKNCIMKKTSVLAYTLAHDKKRSYPKSWDRDKRAGEKWVRCFVARYKDEISKFSSVCKKDKYRMSIKANGGRPTILTKEDEQLLLTQLQEMEIRHGCKCKSCIMKEVPILAYEIARKYERNYPEAWDRDKRAGEKWVRFFVARYKDEISKFSSVCKNEMSMNKTNGRSTIFTKNDEQLLLTQLQEMETQHSCKCKNCIMKKTPILAFTLAHDKKRSYPKSWDRDKQAGEKWVRFFVARYKDEISKFSSVCKNKNYHMSTNRVKGKSKILTKEDEQLLLTQLHEMESQHGCKCKNCIMKEVPILAYKIARKYERSYPETWERDKQAGLTWMYYFVARYKDEISKFSSVCKNEMSNKTNYANSTILTKKDEQLLLTQLQEMETQHGCKCKKCIMKEVPILAYKIARKYERSYPETWERDKQAGLTWMYYFVTRYKDIVSKFSSVCRNETSTNKANAGRSKTLTKEDEQLLLTQLQEMETQHGCKCRNCLMKEVPILAYKIARKYERCYPKTWNRDKQTGRTWVTHFVARYKDEISKFSSVCKKNFK